MNTEEVINGIMNGMDIYSKYIILALVLLFTVLVFWWFYKISVLVSGFLKCGLDVLGGKFVNGTRLPPFYRIVEIQGAYKGREVSMGVIFTGFKNEFLPLPYIQMRLKEALGYNTNRLPNYAYIQKNSLIYKVRLSVLWGVFDKNYPHVFSKSYLIIALEKLLATAEDVERGRTVGEVFK
ncbi:MAG TPA: hypothetical protein DCL35_05095 [Candidatus Omnitrophica bacterium]|nr:hypothetical protein [Candidatus Omnitrophota bacterium]